MDGRKLAILSRRNVEQLHKLIENAEKTRAELDQRVAEISVLIHQAEGLRVKARGLSHFDDTYLGV